MTLTLREERPVNSLGPSYTYFENDHVLLAKVTPCFENGKAAIARGLKNDRGFGSSELYVLRSKGEALPEWLYTFVTTPSRELGKLNMTGTGGLQRVPRRFIESSTIPLPPIEIQRALVAEIEREQSLVDSNRELIERFEKKIEATIGRVWKE